ncbi:MAG TPA: DMT family transporter [Steroidobacteraceae bacterium]|jgi:drug/metabolite transporter (DMT)-like permease
MQSSNLRGILTMFAAIATFSVMDVAMKKLVESYPSMQVAFLRGVASLPFLLGATALFGNWRDMVPQRLPLHILRGFLTVGTLWCFIYAVSVLSLADTYAIFMSAPLLITALSVPMLGEHVGWRRWAAVLVGLVGVIIVLKPSGTSLVTIGGLAALASAVMYAFGAITIRILSRTDSGPSTVFWALLLLSVIAGMIASLHWVPLDSRHWPWIAGLGLSGAVGQYLFTQAFRLAAPPAVAPLEYTALMWGMMFDWLLWATAPSSRMLLGAAVIVGSGLYVLYRERTAADFVTK